MSPNSSSLDNFFDAISPAFPTQFEDFETVLHGDSVDAMERIKILTSGEYFEGNTL